MTMRHVHSDDERRQRHAEVLALQCGRCQQRVVYCPGCGVANFVLVGGYAPLDGTTAADAIAGAEGGGGGGGGGGGATHVVPQGPLTAFELFCRDAEARRVIEDCGDLQDEDSLEGRCSSRRLLAEAWLSADAATRERFETAAATAVAALKPSRAAGVKQLRSSRNASTSRRRKTPTAAAATTTASSSNNATIVSDTAPPSEGDSTAMANTTETGVRRGAGMLVTSYKRPPTSYRLFCKRQRGVYGSNDALMRAWRGMSSTEKQPYDDEAAAIRVALRK